MKREVKKTETFGEVHQAKKEGKQEAQVGGKHDVLRENG